MKRILIVCNNMHIGGVQKALLNLLKEVSDKYDITLILFYKGGEFLDEIPDNVNVIGVSSPYKYLGMTCDDVRSKPFNRLFRGFYALVTKLFSIGFCTRLMSLFQRNIGHFDVAISYFHSGAQKSFLGGCNEFVLRHTNADKKITFLHCDYSEIGADCKYNEDIYDSFDTIVACSDGCRRAFLSVEPQFDNKTITVRNCNDYNDILLKASEAQDIIIDSDRINIVTVARLGREKSVSRAVQAISSLDCNDNLNYYIFGKGSEYEEIARLISNNNLQSRVKLCGEKNNPYPYIKKADFLLIPSLSEAAPMVINESACLTTPILTTNTSSAVEMVEKTGFGFVCDNSVDGIKDGISMLVNNRGLLSEVRSKLEMMSFDNNACLNQFDNLIE